MARQTNLLAMALEAPKRKAVTPPERNDLLDALMMQNAKQFGTPVHSIGQGLARVANTSLLSLMKKWEKDEEKENRKIAGDELFSSLGTLLGRDSASSASPDGIRLAKALKGERLNDGDSFVERVVGVESGGNPTARNPNSSAQGAGQFIDSTWRQFIQDQHPQLIASGQDIGALRNDPDLSRQAVDWYGDQNAQFLEGRGLPVNDGTKYLAHFAGPAGAASVLSADPNVPIETVLGNKVVNANPFLKGMSVSDVQDWASRKMGVQDTVQRGLHHGMDGFSNPVGRFDTNQPADNRFAIQTAGGQGSDHLAGGVRIGDPLSQGPEPDIAVRGGIEQVMAEERQRAQQPMPQHAPQPQNLRQAVGGQVGDPGDFMRLAEQARQGQPPGLNSMMQGQQGQQPIPLGGEQRQQPIPSPMAQSAPPAPEASQIAPGQPQQAFNAPQAAPEPAGGQQQLGGFMDPAEMQMLRTLYDRGEMSGADVAQFVQKRRAEHQAAQQPQWEYKDGQWYQIGQQGPQPFGEPNAAATAQRNEFGLTPMYTTDAEGNTVPMQLSKSGGAVPVELPEGHSVAKGVEKIDTGTEFVFFDRLNNKVVQIIPKDIEGAEAAKQRGTQLGESQAGLAAALQKADESIYQIEQMLKHPGRGTATGMSGLIDPRNYLPGTDATDFHVMNKQLEGKAFLEAFESLKGGGHITEIEGQKATEAMARLATTQSDEAYKASLEELLGILEAGKERARQRAGQAPQTAEPQQPAQSEGEVQTHGPNGFPIDADRNIEVPPEQGLQELRDFIARRPDKADIAIQEFIKMYGFEPEL